MVLFFHSCPSIKSDSADFLSGPAFATGTLGPTDHRALLATGGPAKLG